nr:hypothetical protein [Tanacetum cinerariifolium]
MTTFIDLDIGIIPQQLSLVIRLDLKERDENWCRKTYDYVAYKERSKQVDDRNGFTRDDKPKAEQNGSGTSDRAKSYYKNLEASVEIARKNSPGLSFPTPNAKATSVHDDVGVPDVAVDDNAKAMSICDDIDEANVTADDNAK